MTISELELLAVLGHLAGASVHSLFAAWHWITAGRRFDFWAKFNAGLAIICAGSVIVHMRRVLGE